MPGERQAPGRYARAFWAAAVLTVALWLVPYGQYVIYPFSLLATWAHEMGHGLAALAVGGEFLRLELFADLSGLATTRRGGGLAGAVVSAGGLAGAPALGALIIALGSFPRLARLLLGALGLALLASALLWVRNPFGLAAVAGLGAALGLGAWKLGPRWRLVLVQLVGLQVCLSALRGWRYLFTAQAEIGGRVMGSDVSAISDALAGPYWMWGGLLSALNLALLLGAYVFAAGRMAPAETGAPPPGEG